jgi:hypothetical protein
MAELDVQDIADEARFTSLGLSNQMVATKQGSTCENVQDLTVVNLDTRETWPSRCRRNECDHCLSVNAQRRAFAMALAQPERMLTMTLVAGPGDHDPMRTARIRVKRAREALKRRGHAPGEWCWTVEPNPRGTGFHAHCVQRGRYIPQAELERALVSAGAGKCPRIEWVRDRSRGLKYNLKGFGAAGYGMKGFRPDVDGALALAVNGGRLEHHTRDFYWHDGRRIGVRDAERRALREFFPAGRDVIVVMTSKMAREYLEDTRPNARVIWQPLLNQYSVRRQTR